MLFTEADQMASRAQDLWSRGTASHQLRDHQGHVARGAARGGHDHPPGDRPGRGVGDPALYLCVATGSYVFFLLGEYAEGLAMCDRAIELADGDPGIGANITVECPLAQCVLQKGGILCDLGRLDEARELIERGTRMAAERDAHETVGWGHNWSMWHAYRCGEAERAMTHAQQTVEIAEHLGDAFSRTWSWVLVALAATMQEDWPQAIEAIEHAREIAGDRSAAADSEGFQLLTLGEAHANLGDAHRGVELCRQAVSLLRGREQATEVMAHLTLARVLLVSQGIAARDEIEVALARAEELVEALGAAAVRPLIHIQRAELAHQAGDDHTRELELREAHRVSTEIGATGHAERLATMLGDVTLGTA